MFLVSSIWGEYRKRYTGIHTFNLTGNVKTRSGVNLDDDEWGMLSYNFGSIKEAFASRKDALKNIFTRPKEDQNIVKVYKDEWYLKGKMITTSESPCEFFSWEKAEQNAMCRKPVPGVDYPQKDVHAEMHVDCEVRPALEDTLLMNFVLVETMIRMIEAERLTVKHVRLIPIHSLITAEVVTVWMRMSTSTICTCFEHIRRSKLVL